LHQIPGVLLLQPKQIGVFCLHMIAILVVDIFAQLFQLNQIVQADAHLFGYRLVLFGYVIGILVYELKATVFARFEFVTTAPKKLV
jgi:hypothetical protein